MTAVENRTLSILIFIVALLAEHCDFDSLRDEHPGKPAQVPAFFWSFDTSILGFISDLNSLSEVLFFKFLIHTLKLTAVISRDLSWNTFTGVYWHCTINTKTSVSRDASFSALVSLIAVLYSWISHLHEGFLFRARPTLMTMERSSSIMDDIFHSSDLESHGRLLRIMHDFLISESAKHHEEQKGLNDVLCSCAVLILRRR